MICLFKIFSLKWITTRRGSDGLTPHCSSVARQDIQPLLFAYV